LPRRRPDEQPLYAFDAAWMIERGTRLAGTDEAGRGALAGPIVAAAVVLDPEPIPGLNDSKALAAARREEIFGEVLRRADALSVVTFPAWWIDRYGVGRANREALTRAIEALKPRAGRGLADGNLRLGPGIESLPRADARSAAVAAASVVAKVLRDGAMRALGAEHPEYGFDRHAGYGTAAHRLALAELGPCRVHRLSYAGVGA
jgi:ribonuclease HII